MKGVHAWKALPSWYMVAERDEAIRLLGGRPEPERLCEDVAAYLLYQFCVRCQPGTQAAVIEALQGAWDAIQGGTVRAMIVASPNPALFCAGADIKAFTQLDEQTGREMLDAGHALLREWERSRVITIAAVNGYALGGGSGRRNRRAALPVRRRSRSRLEHPAAPALLRERLRPQPRRLCRRRGRAR